jgi:hypothetical protein
MGGIDLETMPDDNTVDKNSKSHMNSDELLQQAILNIITIDFPKDVDVFP